MKNLPIVYLVDDDEALRLAIGTSVRLAGYDVRLYDSAESLLEVVEASAAGCVVTDLRLPGMSGIELQQQLIQRHIQLPLIFITGYGEIDESVQAVKSGAIDFLEKPVAPAKLISCIKEALRCDEERRQRDDENSTLQHRFDDLTPREKEVVSLVIEGKTNKEIAKVLDISFRTVEKYRAGAMLKLEVDNVVGLAKLGQHYLLETQ